MALDPLVNIGIKAVRSAGKVILRSLDRLDTIKISEKNYNDFVTNVDQSAEQEIIRIIHEAYPEHAILGEESGITGTNQYKWIIDPIDGTNNFIHGNPNFCISLGIQNKDKMEHGIIYDPLRDELFTASSGAGAFLNDRRIRISPITSLHGAIVALGLSGKDKNNLTRSVDVTAALLPRVAGIRRLGSIAMECAYVACGRLDAVWSADQSLWDIAAGLVILREAGGIVTDWHGNPYNEDQPQEGFVAAPNLYMSKLIINLANPGLNNPNPINTIPV